MFCCENCSEEFEEQQRAIPKWPFKIIFVIAWLAPWFPPWSWTNICKKCYRQVLIYASVCALIITSAVVVAIARNFGLL